VNTLRFVSWYPLRSVYVFDEDDRPTAEALFAIKNTQACTN
jgi:hypothetical protein